MCPAAKPRASENKAAILPAFVRAPAAWVLRAARAPRIALPARFRRERVLMVGCGDVGQRLVRDRHRNGGGPRWLALTSQREKRDALRTLGASPLVGNLDDARTLRHLAGLAHRIVHLAPPPGDGAYDPRTRNLLRSIGLMRASLSTRRCLRSGSAMAANWVRLRNPLLPL